MNKLLITAVITFLIFGCGGKKEEKTNHTNSKNLSSGELLSLSDSVKVKLADKLTFINSYEGMLLFHAERYGLVLTDYSGKILNDFNPVGGAENEVGYVIKQICFMKNGALAIASERGISMYSQAGEFLTRMDQKFPYNSLDKEMYTYTKGGKDYFVTEILIPFTNLSFNSSIEDQYNYSTICMVHNLSSSNYQYIFPFPEESVFRQFVQYYPDYSSDVTFVKKHQLFGITYNPDKHLYLYSIDDLSKPQERIVLNPPNFKRPFTITIENGRGDSELTEQMIKCNSRLMNMTSVDDFVYIEYRPGLPKEQSDIPFKEANDLYKTYILKVDVVNKKHVASYELPYEVFHLQGSFNNQLVFSSKNEGYDFETFYLIDAP